MLLLFGVSSVRSQPTLQPLAHPPSDSLRFDMAAFLLDYVFTEPDDDQLSGRATIITTLPTPKWHPTPYLVYYF